MSASTYKNLGLSCALTLCLSLLSCSDVKLNYGIGSGGSSTVSDRNLNTTSPTDSEDLTQGQIAVPTPTPHTGSGSGGGGEQANPQAPDSTASAVPSASPSPLASQEPIRDPVVVGVGSGKFKIRIIPAGPIELSEFGSKKFFQVLLEDLAGNSLNPDDYELLYEFADPSIAELDAAKQNVIAKVNKGTTTLTIRLKDDPKTFITIEVIVTGVSTGGGGGGGGGSGGSSSGGGGGTPTPTATPVPTPSPLDTVKGNVTFD